MSSAKTSRNKPIGDPSYKLREAPQRCANCHERITRRAAQWQLKTTKFCSQECRKESYAKRAFERHRNRDRICPKCARQLPASEFDKRLHNLQRHQVQAACRDCAGKGDFWVDARHAVSKNLCQVCDGIVSAQVNQRLIDRYVTCSRECLNKRRRREIVHCEVCRKDLPWENFPRTTYGTLRPYCYKCDKNKRNVEPGFIGVRPSYHECTAIIKRHAAARKKPFFLSTAQARRLWNAGCELCGDNVGRFVHRQQGEAVNKDSIQPMCRTCAHITKHYPAAQSQLVAHACKIAAHQEKKK